MQRKFLQTLFVSLTTFALLLVGSCKKAPKEAKKEKKTDSLLIQSVELRNIINGRMALVRKLLADPEILECVRKANQKHANITLKEILKMDQKWRNSLPGDGHEKPYLTNPCARVLTRFQKNHPGFPEIFVTDQKGLNVGQTNKTTDLYQADEEWWIKAFNHGKGREYYGKFEYDQSAQVESIPLYFPILDPASRKTIGVAKAVLDIEKIEEEL